MKYIVVLLSLSLTVQLGFAQKGEVKNEKDVETVFTKKNFKFSGSYIAPEVKMGNVYEDMGLFVGATMGISFNESLLIGLTFHGLVHSEDIYAERPPEYSGDLATMEWASINFIYGGLALEYSFFSNKMLHFNIPVVLGPGKVSIKGEDDIFLDRIERSSVFVIEPGLALEFNLFEFLRLDVGVSYRYVTGATLDNLMDEDLTDLSYCLKLKFELFK